MEKTGIPSREGLDPAPPQDDRGWLCCAGSALTWLRGVKNRPELPPADLECGRPAPEPAEALQQIAPLDDPKPAQPLPPEQGHPEPPPEIPEPPDPPAPRLVPSLYVDSKGVWQYGLPPALEPLQFVLSAEDFASYLDTEPDHVDIDSMYAISIAMAVVNPAFVAVQFVEGMDRWNKARNTVLETCEGDPGWFLQQLAQFDPGQMSCDTATTLFEFLESGFDRDWDELLEEFPVSAVLLAWLNQVVQDAPLPSVV
mmetsp:Transcript_101904/g.233357  ORF Transcript_101904/g.233357 Transcript_101904/m.233357 type:complete len:255 (-) Transcript_101904:233-997(-)